MKIEERLDKLEDMVMDISRALDTLSENDDRDKKDNYEILKKVIDNEIYSIDTDKLLKVCDTIRNAVENLKSDLFLSRKEIEILKSENNLGDKDD